MGDPNPAEGNLQPPIFNPPVADLSKPPQFDPSQPSPPAFEPPKQSNFSAAPNFQPFKPSEFSDPPKFTMPAGSAEPPKFSMRPGLPTNPPAFEPPKFAMPLSDSKPMGSPPAFQPQKVGLPVFNPPKSDMPGSQYPELPAGQADAQPKEMQLPKQDFGQPGNFRPAFQPPPGIVFPMAQQAEGPKPGASQGDQVFKLPSQDPPKFSIPNSDSPVPLFKPAIPVPGFSPMKPEGPRAPSQAVKPGAQVPSPWVSGSAKPEESKDASNPAATKFAFKSVPPAQSPPARPTAVPLRDLAELGRPKGLLDIVRDKTGLRVEDTNEWECSQCHLYNTIEFIQCDACGEENKVLAGVLTALEMPGKKREKNLMEKSVEKAKSLLSWIGAT